MLHYNLHTLHVPSLSLSRCSLLRSRHILSKTFVRLLVPPFWAAAILLSRHVRTRTTMWASRAKLYEGITQSFRGCWCKHTCRTRLVIISRTYEIYFLAKKYHFICHLFHWKSERRIYEDIVLSSDDFRVTKWLIFLLVLSDGLVMKTMMIPYVL